MAYYNPGGGPESKRMRKYSLLASILFGLVSLVWGIAGFVHGNWRDGWLGVLLGVGLLLFGCAYLFVPALSPYRKQNGARR